MSAKLKKLWKILGSGFITGSADNDPSGITTYSIAGARTGFSTLWILVFFIPLMVAVQEMSAKIGALTGCGLAGNIRKHYPKWLLVIVAFSIVGANTLNIGADLFGMAGALNLILPINISALAVIIAAIITVLTIKLSYRHITMIFKWLSLSLGAYVIAFFIAGQHDWLALLKGVIPHIKFNRDFLLVMLAVMGTTLSPYLFFWQSDEEAEDLKQKRPHIKLCKFRAISHASLHKIEEDTTIGMIFSNFVSFFIVSLSAATIYNAGIRNIETIEEAARALQPLAGPYTYLIFTVGIISAGFLAIPVLAGSAAYVLTEIFNWKGGLNSAFSKAREFYLVIITSTAIGLLIPFLGISPVQALFYSAIVNALICPLLIIIVIHMATNPRIVGPDLPSPTIKKLAYIAFAIMTIMAFLIIIV